MYLFILLTLVGARTELYSEKIEARVGNQIITSTDLRAEVTQLQDRANEAKTDSTLRKKALEMLIEKALIRNYLSHQQMDVSEQDVDRRVNSIRASQGLSNLDEFRKLLESRGMSFENFKKEVRDQLQNMQFEQVLQRQIVQSIDEKELRSYYSNHINDFSKNIVVDLQECLIPTGSQLKPELKKAIEQFRTEKKSFSSCVSTYSRSPSAAKGGMLGEVEMGMLRKEVETKVFAAKKGQVVAVEIPGAIQLLKILNKKDLGPRNFSDVKDEIKSIIQNERLFKAKERMISELKTSTFIKVSS